MTNDRLPRDYLERSTKRLKAVALLYDESAYADVVRESQEVVELLLKALLRSFGIGAPFSHDLSEALSEHVQRFPQDVRDVVPRLATISRQLRKDLELAFYGSEDVTPSTFYIRDDADRAMAMAHEVRDAVAPWVA